MKSKIAFYIESMTVGGAEKVLLDLVNNLNSDKYEITVIALFKENVYKDYDFHFENGFNKNIKFITLINNKYKIWYYLFNYAQAKINPKILYKLLIKKNYDSKFDKVIGVSYEVCATFKEIYAGVNVECIHNVIDEKFILNKSLENCNVSIDDKGEINFITVGRFIEVKGYERLIYCIEKLISENYKIKLWMIGNGSDFNYIKSLVDKLNLEKNIIFLGHQNNPYSILKKMDLFICSSFFEGLSTVVIESIILNVPVLTTDCGGMYEIFGNYKCGIICKNSKKELYISIKYILDNPNCLENYKNEIKDRKSYFSIENRINQVEFFLDDLIRTGKLN
jgi:glycosyltransferase involved in cell wall biosynthesis